MSLFSLVSVFPAVLSPPAAAYLLPIQKGMYCSKCSEPPAGLFRCPSAANFQSRTLKTPRCCSLFPKQDMHTLIFKDWLLIDYLLGVRHLENEQRLEGNMFLLIHMFNAMSLIGMFCHPTAYRHTSSHGITLLGCTDVVFSTNGRQDPPPAKTSRLTLLQ